MRNLVCLDSVPASDGTCAQSAWIEQTTIADLFELPPAQEASAVFAACFGLVLAMNVAGYVVGAVVKSVSTDRA